MGVLDHDFVEGEVKNALDVERGGNQPELLKRVGFGLLVADDGSVTP